MGSPPDASVVHPVGRRRARVAFMEQGSIRATALALSLVVLVGADVPEVLLQGLVAGLLLCVEGCRVGRDGREVLLTLLHGATDSAEAGTCQGLVGADGSRASDGLQTACVQTAAVGAGGGCRAVSCENHLLVAGVG